MYRKLKVVASATLRTKRLALNVVPTRVWRRDAYLVLRTMFRALDFLQAREPPLGIVGRPFVVRNRVVGWADLVTKGARGAGVAELVGRLLADDLASVAPALRRHEILLGTGPDGAEQRLAPYGRNVLVAGTSGSGKSTFTTAFLEGLCEHHYQYVVIDPEGDYANMEGAVVLGLPERAPLLDEVLDVLRTSGQSAVVNLLGLPLDKRPAFFDRLLPRLMELRARTVGFP